jgi:hypothetical protein
MVVGPVVGGGADQGDPQVAMRLEEGSESWQQQSVGQVAGGAENHEVDRV